MAQLHHPYPFTHQWLALHPKVANLLNKELLALLVVLLLALAGAWYLSSQAEGMPTLESSGMGEDSERGLTPAPAPTPAGEYQSGPV